jgi:hypothetical protein
LLFSIIAIIALLASSINKQAIACFLSSLRHAYSRSRGWLAGRSKFIMIVQLA